MDFDAIIKWVSRVFGIVLVVVSILHLTGVDSPLADNPDLSGMIEGVGIILMCIGALLGFWKDIFGAIVIFCGYTAFAISAGSIFPGPVFPQFLIVALLYVFNGWNIKK